MGRSLRNVAGSLVPLSLLAGTLLLSGCFVEGRCLGDHDCATNQICLTGTCIDCRSAAECTGLLDHNPDSPTYGQTIEIAAFRGDVVLIYLANAG